MSATNTFNFYLCLVQACMKQMQLCVETGGLSPELVYIHKNINCVIQLHPFVQLH